MMCERACLKDGILRSGRDGHYDQLGWWDTELGDVRVASQILKWYEEGDWP